MSILVNITKFFRRDPVSKRDPRGDAEIFDQDPRHYELEQERKAAQLEARKHHLPPKH